MGKKKPPICSVGDRISDPASHQGIVQHTSYTRFKPYKIRWDNGYECIYSAKDFSEYGYTIIKSESESQGELWQQMGIEDITPQHQETELWRLKAGLHPVPYQEGIERFAIACHQLSLLDQLELCQKRIAQQEERLAEVEDIKPSDAPKVKESVTAAVVEETERISQLQLKIEPSSQDFPREWQIGDRIELVEPMEFCRRQLGETGTITDIRNDAAPRFVVTWDKRRPKTNNTTMFLADTKAVQLADQYAAAHQLEAKPSDSLIGKHFYTDHLEVIVEAIASPQNWRETPNSPVIEAVKVRPWWNKLRDRTLPESLLVPLDELTEITDFAKNLTESPKTELSSDSNPCSLGKPENLATKQTGSLYQYTSNKADKAGVIQTYPKVEGDRKREEDSHWYWGYSYIEKERGKWRDKSAAVPMKKLAAVRAALRDRKPYTYILQEILGK